MREMSFKRGSTAWNVTSKGIVRNVIVVADENHGFVQIKESSEAIPETVSAMDLFNSHRFAAIKAEQIKNPK